MAPFLHRTIRINIILAALGTIITTVCLVARDQSGQGDSTSTTTPHAKLVSSAQYGDSYPFTVGGQLFCDNGAIALKVGNTLYPINGSTAYSKLKGQTKPLEAIWKNDPATGAKMSIGQILIDGQKLCP